MPRSNDLTLVERDKVRMRDGWRCLNCGRRPVTIQHRQVKGMGGRGPKARPLTCADAVTLCLDCNVRAEGDLQTLALRSGWKVKGKSLHAVLATPVLDRITGNWWLLDEIGGRTHIEEHEALLLIEAQLTSD